MVDFNYNVSFFFDRYFIKFYWDLIKVKKQMTTYDYLSSYDEKALAKIDEFKIKRKKKMNKEELIAHSQSVDGVKEEVKSLEDNNGIVDLEELAKKVIIHPYFGMDSVSGDMVSFFTSANVKAAVRSFCNSLDHLPLSIVKDLVLVDSETRTIVFEGKDYIEQWNNNQNYRLEQMIKSFKGANHA